MVSVKIMIVEDNTIVAEECRDCLERLGYNITSIVASGAEAIEKAEEEKPDAVLMDINLRDKMDGITAANMIYTQFGIPIVFLSAYSDDKLLELAKDMGSFGYLIKPFAERELYTTLEIALFKSKTEQQNKKNNEMLEEKIKERTHELEDINIALTVLLKKREKDKFEMEEKVLANYKLLVTPLMVQLRNILTQKNQQDLMDILTGELKNIFSPFSKQLTGPMVSLTPAEIKVAELIKLGKTNKEIAVILSISIHTVSRHRENIRKKTGLKNKKTNLRSFLSSIF